MRTPLGIGGIAFAASAVLSLCAVTLGIGITVIAVLVFGVAAMVLGLWSRADDMGRLGLTALAAVAAMAAGITVGVQTYDEWYIYDHRTPLAGALRAVGFLLTLAGVLVLIGSVVSMLVLAVVRMFR